jgi:hypothetical protein
LEKFDGRMQYHVTARGADLPHDSREPRVFQSTMSKTMARVSQIQQLQQHQQQERRDKNYQNEFRRRLSLEEGSTSSEETTTSDETSSTSSGSESGENKRRSQEEETEEEDWPAKKKGMVCYHPRLLCTDIDSQVHQHQQHTRRRGMHTGDAGGLR